MFCNFNWAGVLLEQLPVGYTSYLCGTKVVAFRGTPENRGVRPVANIAFPDAAVLLFRLVPNSAREHANLGCP